MERAPGNGRPRSAPAARQSAHGTSDQGRCAALHACCRAPRDIWRQRHAAPSRIGCGKLASQNRLVVEAPHGLSGTIEANARRAGNRGGPHCAIVHCCHGIRAAEAKRGLHPRRQCRLRRPRSVRRRRGTPESGIAGSEREVVGERPDDCRTAQAAGTTSTFGIGRREPIHQGDLSEFTKEVDVMTDTASLPQRSSIWWVFLLQGFAGIILGLMLVTEPGATIVALTTVLGFYWLVTGVLGLVQVFVDRSTPWIWSLLGGLVGILAGLFVLRHPLVAALTVPTMIVIILGIQGLVMGALQIIGGFKGGGIGPFILGAINVLVGILLLGSPIAAALAVPLVFGVLLLIQGIGLIVLAFRVRT